MVENAQYFWMADLNKVVDLMGRGMYWADLVSTVSETYAQEILTPEYGERLDPLLCDRRDRLFGVLSGVDHQRCMAADLSWRQSESMYVQVYRRAIASRIPRPGLETYQVRT